MRPSGRGLRRWRRGSPGTHRSYAEKRNRFEWWEEDWNDEEDIING